MAKKKEKAQKKEEVKETKKVATKKAKKELTPEEKAAKKKARQEALKNRPAGQRPNSKQIDIIDLGNGSKVLNFASPVRKHGSLITSVAVNSDGEVTSTAVTFIEGVSPKCKKGHGTLVPKVPGLGKHNQPEDVDEDDDQEETEEEDED